MLFPSFRPPASAVIAHRISATHGRMDATMQPVRRALACFVLLASGFMVVAISAAAEPKPAPHRALLAQSYSWRNVVVGGGGFVSGLVFHPAQRDLLYARTDVGGAYRWD